jgi:hypothetical protein
MFVFPYSSIFFCVNSSFFFFFFLTFEIDMNYPGEKNKLALLRYELIIRYFDLKRSKKLQQKLTQIRDERQKKVITFLPLLITKKHPPTQIETKQQ